MLQNLEIEKATIVAVGTRRDRAFTFD